MPLVAPASTVITQSELERIKYSTQEHPVPDYEVRRRELRQKCQERVKHWKNTLSVSLD